MERGGAWRRIVRRRGMDSTVVLPVAAPCQFVLYAIPSSGPPGAAVLTITGVVAAGGGEVSFTIASTQTQALALPRYEYRVTAVDPGVADTIVLLRGYITVYDSVQG